MFELFTKNINKVVNNHAPCTTSSKQKVKTLKIIALAFFGRTKIN